MSDYPEQVQRLHDAIDQLPGVKVIDLDIRRLEGIGEKELSFPGEFGDLPHLAIRRTKGGRKNEVLVNAEIRLYQNMDGWIALEFLAWWVRDLSRGGEWIQMRPLALPPVAYGTQLGRTLKFVIEFFFINPNNDNTVLLEKLGDFADDLKANLEDYRKVLANPTHADHDDVASLKQAAENEDAAAQLALAQCYEQGEGVRKDKAKAFHWYKRAARHGHPEAVMKLGLCYEKGTGSKPNPKKAYACYQEAADADVPFAMALLGGCYEKGSGVGQDLAKAAKWYRQGAECGDPVCQAELGECFEYGKGVKRNLQNALHWYRAALEQGFEAVQPAIDRVEAALT